MEITSSYCRYVRRPNGHMLELEYIMKNIRFCSKSILIRRSIKCDGSRILIRFSTRWDSIAYQAVLEEGFQYMYADDPVFMHDGTLCHASQSTMLYLEKNKIYLFSDIPLQSPDINVIKNMRSILKTCVFQFNITSSDDL